MLLCAEFTGQLDDLYDHRSAMLDSSPPTTGFSVKRHALPFSGNPPARAAIACVTDTHE
jgi:hypothetical protein